MPNFEITSPDGRTFQVTAPEGASQDDVLAYAQKNMPPAQTQEAAPEANPRWDVLGDTGRAAEQSFGNMTDAASKSFGQLGPDAREQRFQQNVAQNGSVLGTLKDALVDTPAELGNAVKAPLSAMGVLGSPVSGGIGHGLLGSALSYIPGMAGPGPLNDTQRNAIENNPIARVLRSIGMNVPGAEAGGNAKQNADALIDRASAFVAPETMGHGFSAAGQLGQTVAGAPQAAQVQADAANATARAANPSFAAARDAGYVVHPADTGGNSTLADLAAQIGGKIKTQQAASVHNQEITNAIAAKELGLPAGTSLDETAFGTARANAAQAYKAIENSASSLPTGRIVADNDFLNDIVGLDARSADFVKDFPEAAAKRSSAVQDVQSSVLKSDFSPKAGIEMIRGLRQDASANLKNALDPDKMRIGFAQRDAANALENLVERNLTAAGNASAVQDYQSARQLIAKSHDIEAVTDAAGNVNARKLAALGQRRPLSGGLKTIADAAEAFPKSMQVPAGFGGVEKRSILDTTWSLGTLAGAVASGHPEIAAAAALPFVRPLARDIALSPWLQNSLLGLRQIPGNLGPGLKAGAIPTLGAQTQLRAMLSAPQLPPYQQQ